MLIVITVKPVPGCCILGQDMTRLLFEASSASLEVGRRAVWVAVASGHDFNACCQARFLIKNTARTQDSMQGWPPYTVAHFGSKLAETCFCASAMLCRLSSDHVLGEGRMGGGGPEQAVRPPAFGPTALQHQAFCMCRKPLELTVQST